MKIGSLVLILTAAALLAGGLGSGLTTLLSVEAAPKRTASVARGEVLHGFATWSDGDTPKLSRNGHIVEKGAQRLRLYGIDAVESRQTCLTGGQSWACGKAAQEAVTRFVNGRPIDCEVVGEDRKYDRPVVVCRVEGQDINAWMARNGWAIVQPEYQSTYVTQMYEAQRDCLNLWKQACGRGQIEIPSRKRAQRECAATGHAASCEDILQRQLAEFEANTGFQPPWAYRQDSRSH